MTPCRCRCCFQGPVNWCLFFLPSCALIIVGDLALLVFHAGRKTVIMVATSLNSLAPIGNLCPRRRDSPAVAVASVDRKFVAVFVSLGIITLDARINICVDTILIVALLTVLAGFDAAAALPASCAVAGAHQLSPIGPRHCCFPVVVVAAAAFASAGGQLIVVWFIKSLIGSTQGRRLGPQPCSDHKYHDWCWPSCRKNG